MNQIRSRRAFLSASAVTLSAGSLLPDFAPISRGEVAVDPGIVQLRPEIEPLVRLIEESPRERLL